MSVAELMGRGWGNSADVTAPKTWWNFAPIER